VRCGNCGAKQSVQKCPCRHAILSLSAGHFIARRGCSSGAKRVIMLQKKDSFGRE
jgi:hypothetical protein